MIDKESHKNTQYRIKSLQKQFDKIKKEITFYIWYEKNWDGYNGEPITLDTIKHTVAVLNELHWWFEKNIGFLNNRSFEIDSTPNSNGHIHIDIEYDCYSLDAYIKNDIELSFTPQYRHNINGEYTIYDRKTGLIYSTDIMNKKFHNLEQIPKFLDVAFYEHKWKF